MTDPKLVVFPNFFTGRDGLLALHETREEKPDGTVVITVRPEILA